MITNEQKQEITRLRGLGYGLITIVKAFTNKEALKLNWEEACAYYSDWDMNAKIISTIPF